MFYRFRENREKRGKGGVKGLYFRGGKGGYFKALNSSLHCLVRENSQNSKGGSDYWIVHF